MGVPGPVRDSDPFADYAGCLAVGKTLTVEEIKAAVEIGHPLGKKVAVHSYGPEGAKRAAMAGVDTIEHAIDMDDETLAMMKAKGIYYIPTIDHNRFYADNAVPFEFRKGIGDDYNAFIAKNIETARKALKAGVKIGCGSLAAICRPGGSVMPQIAPSAR